LSNNTESIKAKAGQIFEIKLPGIPATGYAWELAQGSESPGLIALQDVRWEEGQDKVAGSPNFQIFRLKALSEGRTRLVFQLRRAWEKNTAKEERIFSLTIEP
jgi:predicted secreted protein